jgi:hypothetical protein
MSLSSRPSWQQSVRLQESGEGDSPATWSHRNLTEPVTEVQNRLQSKTSRLMIITTTVFEKTVSTCLKETSPLLAAQMLKQYCSHKRRSTCSSDTSTLASACITTWKAPMWLHKITHHNAQVVTQKQWQTNICNIYRYLNDTWNFSEKNYTSTPSNWQSKVNFGDLNSILNTIMTSHWNQYFTCFQAVRGTSASTARDINQLSNKTTNSVLAQWWDKVE